MNESADPTIIRLTTEELTNSHADDLVTRYKNMRGDNDVNRSGRRWYLRNWFVLALAGMVGAFAAWAILEPFFDDHFYVQGNLSAILGPENISPSFDPEKNEFMARNSCLQFLVMRTDSICVVDITRERHGNSALKPLNSSQLDKSREVGIMVDFPKTGNTLLPIAEYIVFDPPKNPPKKALLPLSRIKNRSEAAGFLLFPLIAGMIGLFIGAIDGIICRLARRAMLGGSIGFLVGFIGGFILGYLGGLIYAPFTNYAMNEFDDLTHRLSTFGFIIQMLGRTLAWGFIGMAMGLGQGAALKSKRLLLYGFLGGIIGGLLGGLLFDPIDLLLFPDSSSAAASRGIGFAVIGASVGAMIGIVELLSRDAWLRMTEGPLAGKEFLLFKDSMRLGSSPSSDMYLFNDTLVSAHHATLYAVGDECEIENRDAINPILVNSMRIQRARLRHGDKISIGKTCFVFEKRQK